MLFCHLYYTNTNERCQYLCSYYFNHTVENFFEKKFSGVGRFGYVTNCT